jgi:ectoine hydroxylase-related dioxygenase (phytanoyl-CoA dioxygenase family)
VQRSEHASAAESSTTERHPWNQRFEWWTPTGPHRALSDAQAKQFNDEGYVVLEDVLDLDVIDELRAELDAYEAKTTAFLREQESGRLTIAEDGAITFTTHVVARNAVARAFSALPLFVDLCLDLIGPDVNLYWDQAVYKKPEKPRRFPWHQDNGYAYVEPQQYLTCWVPLTDATLENGCPQVARRLHRLGTMQHLYVDPLGFECLDDPDDVAVAEVRAGGVVVFSSLTPHLTGPNTTDAVRKAYILQYAPAGAEVLRGDPSSTEAPRREPTDAPERQYAVARGGARVAPPALP